MQGLSGPQEAGAWRFRRWAIWTALFIVLSALILSSSAPGPVRLTVTSVGMIGGAASMMVGFRLRGVTAARAGDPDARRRVRAWNHLAAAAVLSAVSNFLLVVLTTLLGDTFALLSSYVTLAMALAFAAVGVLTFPLARRRGTDLARMVLDGVVIGGSGLFVTSVTVFTTFLANPDGGAAFSIAVPVGDIVMATVATLLFLRAAPQDRLPLGIAAVGFTCYAVSDFAYAVLSSLEGRYYFGTPTDLGWITGYALFSLAAHSPGSEAVPHGERPVERSPVLGTAITFGLFLTAAGFNLAEQRSGGLSTTSAVLWVAVLLAVLARQLLLIIDNNRLHRGLERAVEDRTRELRQETEWSRLLVTSVGDGIYGVDPEGRVTFVNPAAAEALGYVSEELEGRTAHTVFHATHPDGTPFPLDRCYVTEAVVEQKTTHAEEDSYLRSDGLAVPVEVTATPLIDDGVAVGAVVVFRDVTQRREVDRMKSEFVSMVSHELRTPLTAIRGALGLIAGGAVGELNPKTRRMVEIALVSTDRLGRLINEILDIERIESGMLSMELAIQPCRPLVEAAAAQVQVLAEEAGVRVSVGATEGQVHADADRVVQTLLNLLGNAIKFSHRGGYVSVHTQVKGEFVEFAIRDDGRGIPEDKLDHIFDRFSQVDSSDAREKGGSGLGLSISRSIVERLGGRIWARNNPGVGATFLFTLPTHEPVDNPPPTDGVAANGSRAYAPSRQDVAPSTTGGF